MSSRISLWQKSHLGFRVVSFVLAVFFAMSTMLFLARVSQAEITTRLYNFNNTSSEALLSGQFVEGDDDYDPFGYSTNAGLGGSGAVVTSEISNIWTTRQALSVPEVGDSYVVSGYFFNDANDGFGEIGFAPSMFNYQDYDTAPGYGIGVASHGSGADLHVNASKEDEIEWDDEYELESDTWYKAVLEVTAVDTEDAYEISFSLFSSDANGTLGSAITEYSTAISDDYMREDARKWYAYFSTTDDRFAYVDNFEVQASNFVPLPAPTDIRSYTNEETGDVFLGGDYIELGLSQLGSFGTTEDQGLPANFFGTDARTAIGMSTNPAGFGVEPDLRMDFFMPGSPEERWAVGYKVGSDTYNGSNTLLEDADDIPDNTVTNQSSGGKLQATSEGTFNDAIKTKQVVSFDRADRFFKNEVTLQNVSGSTVNSARYMRTFDPDNTVDQGGAYDTRNTIAYTHAAGDGKAVVVADTGWNDEDPVFKENGSRSPIFFYSADPSARVSSHGFGNDDPYEEELYEAVSAKDTSIVEDEAINIVFDTGSLAPGQSRTFVYFTSLDSRDISEVLQDIETAGPSNDKNGDGIIDNSQANVHTATSSVTNKTVVLEVDDACAINSALLKAENSNTIQDPGYDYPEGLVDFNVDCGTPGYTTTVKLYYYDIPEGAYVLRKYNPSNNAYFTVNDSLIERVNIYGQSVIKAAYQVTDGGYLDIDGVANGVIIDPAGIAVTATGSPNTGLGSVLGKR